MPSDAAREGWAWHCVWHCLLDCRYSAQTPGNKAWNLWLEQKEDCTLGLVADFYTKQGKWRGTGIAHCWADRYELTGGAECFPGVPGVPSCQFPNTITVEPVGIYSLEDTDCIRCQTCDKPTNAPEPEVGPPACQLDKCHCAACEAAREQAAIRIPRPLGGTGACGCASGCDVGLNVNNGNLAVRLGMPDAGSLAPADVLSYPHHTRLPCGTTSTRHATLSR